MAIICAANIPALVAPAVPAAKVATGTPAGICSVERIASRPFKLCAVGTPKTGLAEWAATAPAR